MKKKRLRYDEKIVNLIEEEVKKGRDITEIINDLIIISLFVIRKGANK